ncbi:DUF6252 family protein [Flavobacterium sp. SUN052]|uniref:DUF6252 family protein n=1 Tax=Flavobacterium sp. SUN052 TaxID=3002441 RepID=UPI00237D6B59|nr:DUF6252 family protein [Flavobacterium sp. SUN052]MEC4004023.1 DUF6252 family protein [Flavobacterium sp. SUN052]
MKKIICLIVILSVFSSCTTDVKFNNPGFQAYRDGVLFKGIDAKAYKSTNGTITLVGLAQDEEVNIDVANSNVGTYYFGTTNQATKAFYNSTFNNVQLSYATDIVSGPVANMSAAITAGGTGYVSDCTLVNGTYACSNSHQTTGGSGSGLSLSVITNAAGVVTSVKVASPGNGYIAGDLITITGGGNNAKVKVLNVEGSNGEIKITENTGDTISGEFKFNAINTNGNPSGPELVNFQYGTFYKVPVLPAP